MYDKEKLAQIKLSQQKWEEENAREFEKELKKEFTSESGIPIKRIYTPLDLEGKGFDYLEDVGFPGQYPCTRGDTPTMYRSGLWPMSQIVGHATLKETNAIYKRLIADGLRAIVIARDMAGQHGYDPGHPKAAGEVGRMGVSVSSLRDFEILMDGINLGEVLISYFGNALATVNIAEHLVLAEKQGIAWKDTQGYLQNDILKEYSARGAYIFPPEPSIRLIVDSLEFCAHHAPKYSPLAVCSYHQAEKGATPVHEIAFMLSNLIVYLQAAVDRGLDIDFIAPRIRLHTFFSHIDFFEQVAKFRATRRLWAKIMKDRFKAKNSESMTCHILPLQAGTSVYKEQYLNNIARSAIAILGCAMIGGRRNEPRTYDEQFGISTEESLRTALRVQQIVGYETGVCDTIDPLAGSYFVEYLTSELEERITKEIETIDNMGGALKAIEQGYIQRTLAKDGYEKAKALLEGKTVRVGVNRFRSDGEEERPTTIYRADPRYEEKCIAELEKLRRERDNQRVTKALDNIKAVAGKKASAENNLMPFIVEAVKAYTTRGEIADVLREVWGEYPEPAIF